MFNKAKNPRLFVDAIVSALADNTRKYDVRTETVNYHHKQYGEDPLSQILNFPYIL